MRRSWAGLLILLLVCAAMPAYAQSAPSNGFTTVWSSLDPGDDWSATIINNIFPTTTGNGSSVIQSENTAIGQILGQFTGFIMALAAAWVSYATIIQIHRAAETGRVLSNVTSSWAPVRLFLAIVMMFPLSTGFSAGQGAVIQVAMWGIGIARTVYTNAIQSIGPDAMPIATPMIPGTRGIVAGLFQNELCRDLVNLASGNAGLVPEPTPSTGGTAGQGGYITWAYVMSAGDAIGLPVCGTVTIREPGQNANVAGVNIDMTQQQQNALTAVLSRDIQPAAQQAAQALWQTRQASSLTPLMGAYTTAVTAYTNQLTTDATQATQQLQTAFQASGARSGDVDLQQGQNELEDLGWTGAGAYYLEIADLDGRTLSLLSATPDITAPTYTGLGPSLSSDMAPLVSAVLAFQTELNTYVQTSDGLSAPGGNADIVTGASPSEENPSLLEEVLRKLNLAEPAVQALIQAIAPTTNTWQDPFTALIHLGHVLIMIALGAITMATVLASSTGSAATTAWNLLTFNWGAAAATFTGHMLMSFLATPILYGCLALLIPGIILAFVLPMVPFVMWLAGVAGWFILVFEAIVAVPLWAFAHLTFQGDGLHGKGLEGYSLLLNILVRPVLMLIGLFLGYYMFTCLSWLIFQSFGVAAHFVLADGYIVTNLLGAIVMISMFVLLHLMVALLSFRMISLFPHHVIKMIGFATPANRVHMDRFALDATTIGMGATIREIKGGTRSILSYSQNGGNQGGSGSIRGGSGGGGGAPRQIGMDSTVAAASDVSPPAPEDKED
jgi:conjugal transfer/type IV secretion protein DotA/TraY